jgi:hypothetical protein
MSKPWLETWEAVSLDRTDTVYLRGPELDGRNVRGCEMSREDGELAAAAPALVRALLDVEWNDFGYCWRCGEDAEKAHPSGHEPDCPIDAALTAAGLVTQTERNAARAEMAKP